VLLPYNTECSLVPTKTQTQHRYVHACHASHKSTLNRQCHVKLYLSVGICSTRDFSLFWSTWPAAPAPAPLLALLLAVTAAAAACAVFCAKAAEMASACARTLAWMLLMSGAPETGNVTPRPAKQPVITKHNKRNTRAALSSECDWKYSQSY
jgi:hypothetical protein